MGFSDIHVMFALAAPIAHLGMACQCRRSHARHLCSKTRAMPPARADRLRSD